MYEAYQIAERIKVAAKSRNIVIKVMLEECGLSKNTLSSMISGGSTPKSENLAKIADYLNCSVDYLLGRTDSPEVTGAYINGDNNGIQAVSRDNSKMTVNGAAAPNKDTLTEQFMQKFEQLDFDDKVDVMQYVKNKK